MFLVVNCFSHPHVKLGTFLSTALSLLLSHYELRIVATGINLRPLKCQTDRAQPLFVWEIHGGLLIYLQMKRFLDDPPPKNTGVSLPLGNNKTRVRQG